MKTNQPTNQPTNRQTNHNRKDPKTNNKRVTFLNGRGAGKPLTDLQLKAVQASEGEVRDSDGHWVNDGEAAVLVLVWNHQSKSSTRSLRDDIASFRRGKTDADTLLRVPGFIQIHYTFVLDASSWSSRYVQSRAPWSLVPRDSFEWC